MKNPMRILILTVTAVVALAGCGRDAAEVAAEAGPDTALVALADAIRENEIQTFLRRSLSEAEYAEARREWDAARAGEVGADDAARLNEVLAHISQEDVVEEMMREVGPALEGARQNLPMMLFAAQTMGHASIAKNEQLTEAQKTSANELLAAFGKWAGGRDLADPALAHEAMTVWVTGARRMDLQETADLQALEFEEMTARAGMLLEATKAALRVYEFDLDEVLASVQAETLRQQGDTALVRVSFRLLDTDQEFDLAMVRREERWLPEAVRRHADEALKAESGI